MATRKVVNAAQAVNDYQAMVALHARAAWAKLPPRTRSWIGVDDMVSDGVRFTLQSTVHRYQPDRGVSFSTFMYHVLERFYAEHYVNYHYYKLRRDDRTTSIQDMQAHYAEQGKVIGVDEVLLLNGGAEAVLQEDPYQWCGVADVLVTMYKKASPVLKEEIVRWFLQEKTKHHLHGQRFNQARKEFKKLANQFAVSIDDCRHVLRSPVCLDAMSRAILCLPYDVNNPTPGLRGYDTRWRLF